MFDNEVPRSESIPMSIRGTEMQIQGKVGFQWVGGGEGGVEPPKIEGGSAKGFN